MKKLVALLLAVLMVFGLMTTAFAAEGELAGKTVILHTNDVHGAVGLYAKVAALKKDYQAKGAERRRLHPGRALCQRFSGQDRDRAHERCRLRRRSLRQP